MTSLRNPYPFPRYESDLQFCRQIQRERKPIGKSCYDNPWQRLSINSTFSKDLKIRPAYNQRFQQMCNQTKRNLYNQTKIEERGAFRDSLDLQLASIYNHHSEFLKERTETCLQKSTLSLSDNCPARSSNRKTIKSAPVKSLYQNSQYTTLAPNHPLRVVCSATKKPIHVSKNALSGHHAQTTNNGFTRKPDGGFYVF